MNLVDRARNLLLYPRREWTAIAAEPHTVHGLYTGYVMPLAAIPAIAQFIGHCLIGVAGTRLSIAHGVMHLVMDYGISLAAVYLLASMIDALAPVFGAQRDFSQAIKVAAFAPTAAWLSGAFSAIPMISVLIVLGVYSFYLLFVGLEVVMKLPADKVPGYTAVIVIAAIVLWVLAAMLSNLALPGRLRGF